MPRIIAEIRSAHPDVDVSGEGGNPLTDSRAVELILGLLTCLDHPGHTAARYLVLKSAATAFGFPANVRPEESPRPSERRVFHILRRSLMDRGFAAVLREWVRHALDEEVGGVAVICRCASRRRRGWRWGTPVEIWAVSRPRRSRARRP